jgi:hypothetical protein
MISWFISPWEAARFSMEAQRLVALQLFGFAFPKAQHQEQPREERGTDEEKAPVPLRASTTASSEDVLPRSKGVEPVQRRNVAARSKRQMTKKAPGTRKRKSRAGKGK